MNDKVNKQTGSFSWMTEEFGTRFNHVPFMNVCCKRQIDNGKNYKNVKNRNK